MAKGYHRHPIEHSINARKGPSSIFNTINATPFWGHKHPDEVLTFEEQQIFNGARQFDAKTLNSKTLDQIREIFGKMGVFDIYFKDFIETKQDGTTQRYFVFNSKPYEKEELEPYTSSPTIIGMRKLGMHTVGIGKLK